MALFLQILKIIGIVLLCILALLVVLLLLVLFVPIRYRVSGERKVPDDAPVRLKARVTWLLRLVSVSFLYPEQAYVKVKVLGIKVFSTELKDEEEKKHKKNKSDNGDEKDGAENTLEETKTTEDLESSVKEGQKDKGVTSENQETQEGKDAAVGEEETAGSANAEENEEEVPTVCGFFKKLWDSLKNIKYTIQKIYDKIREIIKNIRYYCKVLQSEPFERAFGLCKNELFEVLMHILPGKLNGEFVIGTGDPASTAQVLAIHGILYPLIGNHITVIPDFENTIVKGDFSFKGRVTVFRLLLSAMKLYFNRDLKRVIRLLKREAAVNVRK